MKLMSFISQNRSTFGLVEGEYVYDLGRRLGKACPDLLSAIKGGWLNRLEALVENSQPDFHVDDVVFLPVIPNAPRIFCAGLNYLAHRVEGNRPDTEVPVIFLRLNESQVGHNRPLVCPAESDQFDFEGEIAIVIGKGGRRIPEDQAFEHVAGYSCYNDGSVRDWQLATNQWTPGKNFDATGGFGPWLVTTDELSTDRVLSLVTRLNGEEMQRTTTDMLTFSIPTLISFISTFTSLEPGDVIVTGTPGGVGLRRNPQVWMKEGDVVEVEVEGVGILKNTIIKETLRK
ncbi:5-carboxymethyl-2-hydroxymuconate isomerase [Advenella faeciporci]|uniref:5-carboxymethyl-2-hydroxymuconate isomerase n=1 Tax=Advenella faeciporci TaxID=797535 RepID=A0A918JEW0_9BURK|nr:fumarylacetoacetate hydrolase family protein [Advenella faeciporci]GGW75533.1 5-carboxymethyl-2-hydroxymuconate isomerase [Advenella faeciporci]